MLGSRKRSSLFAATEPTPTFQLEGRGAGRRRACYLSDTLRAFQVLDVRGLYTGSPLTMRSHDSAQRPEQLASAREQTCSSELHSVGSCQEMTTSWPDTRAPPG